MTKEASRGRTIRTYMQCVHAQMEVDSICAVVCVSPLLTMDANCSVDQSVCGIYACVRSAVSIWTYTCAVIHE